jgi:long-chain fatty acid transport protein
MGWSLGAQYRRGPLSLGLSYKSAIEHELDGSVTLSGLTGALAGQNGTRDATATFSTPWQAIAGVRYALNPQWTLNAQIVRFGWSEFDTIEIGAPVNTSIEENYRDTWNYAVGVDYAVAPAWTLRAGVQYDETPTRDGHRDARVPDANRVNFALGASHDLNQAFTIDAAFNYISFDDSKIDRDEVFYDGTGARTTMDTNGNLRNANAMVFSVGGRFKF